MAWGGWFTSTLTADARAPEAHLVNRRGGEIDGRLVHTSLADVPDGVDLAVLAINAGAIPEAIEQGLERGVRAFVVVASGFGELSDEGRRAEHALAERVRAAGGVLVGPNCMGFYEAGSHLNAIGDIVPSGPVAFVSQSGNLTVELAGLLQPHGLGFSRLVSLGNAADLSVSDVIASVADHEQTRVVCCYVEDTSDGRGLVDSIRATSERKPVVVLPVGRSAIGADAAASHTGALASEWRTFEAALRDAGARVVRSMGELADAVAALALQGEAAGRRIAVLSDGGGNAAIAADLADEVRLELPELGSAVLERLIAEIPTGRASNPVDLAGAGERDIYSFARIGEAVLSDPGVDALLLTGYFGGYAHRSDGIDEEIGQIEATTANRLSTAARAAGKPFLVHSMHALELPGIAAFHDAGVPVYTRLDQAIRALALLPRPEIASVGQPAAPPTLELSEQPTYDQARELLAAAGVSFASGRLATSPDEAVAAARELGGPVALKAVGAELLHKTDLGGVELGVEAAAAGSAYEAVLSRVRERRPGLVIDGVFIEQMASAGLDLIIGARRDPSFGPIILVGVGGIFAEALDDIAITLAPATTGHVARLLRRLRAASLLSGARGQPPVDTEAIASVAVALGDLLCGRPELDEIEINPLRAWSHGARALDARVVARHVRVKRGQEVPEWQPDHSHSLTSTLDRA